MNVTCKCGCDLFEQIIPCVFDDSDFRAWHSGSELAAEIRTIPALRCMQCGRLSVPPTSLVGRTMLDPAVQAYGRLIEYVGKWNKGIENSEKSINRIHELQDKINDIMPSPSSSFSTPPEPVVGKSVTARAKKNVKAS